MAERIGNDAVELFWCSRRGWVLRAPAHTPDSALVTLCAHAKKSYEKALANMHDGHPKKRLFEFAIGELQKLRVTQEITPTNVRKTSHGTRRSQS